MAKETGRLFKHNSYLKLSAANCGESSILMEQYRSAFAHLLRSKLRGMRTLPNSTVVNVLGTNEEIKCRLWAGRI
jgi:hypothetical protein